MLLVESRKAAEQVIQEALRQFEEPTLISCAGSAGTLLPGLQVPNPYSLMLPVGIKPHGTLSSGVLSPAACQNHLGRLGPTERSVQLEVQLQVLWHRTWAVIFSKAPRCDNYCFSHGSH